MSQQAQTVFLIERLQTSWLPTDAQRKLHICGVALATLLSAGIPIAVASGLAIEILTGGASRQFGPAIDIAIGLAFGLTAFLASKRAFGLKEGLANGCAFGAAFGLAVSSVFGIAKGIAFGGIAGGVSGVAFVSIGNLLLLTSGVSRKSDRIETVDALSWSWSRAALGLMVGILLGLSIELCLSAARGLSFLDLVNLVSALFAGSADFWLLFELTAILAIGPIIGVLSGLTGHRVEQTVAPNQGIWRSLRNASLTGSIISVAVAFSLGGSSTLAFGLEKGSAIGLCSGIAVGVAVWVSSGGLAVLQHFTLRLLLTIGKHTPWRYSRFLDYAAERIFLRKVGGGYIFIHRLLQDHFASLYQGE